MQTRLATRFGGTQLSSVNLRCGHFDQYCVRQAVLRSSVGPPPCVPIGTSHGAIPIAMSRSRWSTTTNRGKQQGIAGCAWRRNPTTHSPPYTNALPSLLPSQTQREFVFGRGHLHAASVLRDIVATVGSHSHCMVVTMQCHAPRA